LRGAFFHFRNQLVDVDAIKVQLKRHDIRISMDGKGAWSDNVFVERLWRSIKYEEIYLKAYDSVCAARCAIAQCPHQAHS
jgi:putative transposase